MAIYNHAFDVAFDVRSENDIADVTPEELLAALKARVTYLENNPDELREACGGYDSYSEDD